MNLLRVLLFIFILSSSTFALDKHHVLIVHSYSQEYLWTKKQHDAFVSTLKQSNQDFNIYVEYLDTKRLKLTPEYQNRFLSYLKYKYANTHIDLIYTTDDNALEFIYKTHSELPLYKKDIPVFFSGVNNLEMNELLSSDSYAGIFEVKDVSKNIELIKQFSPQTRDIWFIGDNSNTYHAIKKVIQKQSNKFSNINFHFVSDENISKVKEKLPNNKRTFVLLTTIGNLKDSNEQTLLPNESINVLKNKNHIIMSMEDAYMSKGVIGGYVTSGSKQGQEAAKLVLKYISANSLKGIESSLISPNEYIFNSKELTDARIILSEYIARGATITGKDKNFIERNNYTLLNIVFILLILLLIVFFTLYSIQRKKYRHQNHQLAKLQDIAFKNRFQKQLLENSFGIGGLGYWKLDVENNKIFISEELINMLEIDIESYKSDPEFLKYYLNANDKKILFDNIDYVINSKKSIKFNHKIILSEKSVFDAKHNIFAQRKSKHEPFTIIGILKFDN